MIRLIIVDDHQVLIDGISALLATESDIEIVGSANSGEELMTLLHGKQPDLVLLDIQMPGDDGVEVCRQVKAKYHNIRVIALTMYDEASFISGMIRSGANGYILKNTGKAKLLEAIRAVHNGEHWFDPRLGNALLKSLLPMSEREPLIQAPRLTKREKEIVKLIANGSTTQEIAEQLFIGPPTVESHRRNVLTKLNARNSAEMVKIVMEKGLLS